MPTNNSFPPPSTDEKAVIVSVSKILTGLGTFIILGLVYAAILNGLYVIAENGGVVDWEFSFVEIFLAVLFVQFIRVLDAVWRSRLQ